MNARSISLPLTDGIVETVCAGDMLHLNGTIYTARDAAHKRMLAEHQNGLALPIPLAGQVIYYVGPAPAKAGQVIGPAGPTTSGRMDPYTIPLLALGVTGFIGKGYRSPEIKAALVEYRAIYMAAVGGAAALIARHVKANRLLAYEDLGTEAIRELQIEEFPVIVVNDILGNDAYQMGKDLYKFPS